MLYAELHIEPSTTEWTLPLLALVISYVCMFVCVCRGGGCMCVVVRNQRNV